MREIKIGEKTIRVRATPLALLYYKQEFKSDLVGNMIKMQGIEKDPAQFDSVLIMQVIWAMAKADSGPGSQFPSFEKWVSGLDSFDVSDPELINNVLDEASDGFFRRGSRQKPKKARS